jgi:hypothetical protein
VADVKRRYAVISEMYAEQSSYVHKSKFSTPRCQMAHNRKPGAWQKVGSDAPKTELGDAQCVMIRRTTPLAARRLACSGDQDTSTVLLLLSLLLPLKHCGQRLRLQDALAGNAAWAHCL